MKQETAKIFRAMQDSDAHREDMKQSILDRAKEYLKEKQDAVNNSIVGKAYDMGQDVVQKSGLLGGLHDAYRRIFENGWFQKDVFDGRWHADNKAAHGEEHSPWPSKEAGYDHRQSFYGIDKQSQQEQGSHEQARGQDLDRGDELGR